MILKPHLWILEDDPSIAFMYKDILEKVYPIRLFQGLEAFKSGLLEVSATGAVQPSLVIADLRLGEESFLHFLMTRETAHLIPCPFIIVSGLDDLETLRACFAEGANDFLTKPFQKNELLIKIERILSLPSQPNPQPTAVAPEDTLLFDPKTFSLRRGNQEPVFLTIKQIQIYTLLHRAEGRPLSRKILESEIWPGVSVSTKSLDVHLFHLRQKLQPLGVEIHWNPASGYSLIFKAP